ncbi:unnamed protein product [Peniophora sp. CBMAI 1063]|nr:unnamed protein product [Peniophora sp. CBMAI 1063]
MAGRDTILNALQVAAIATILKTEFEPAVQRLDPTFSGGFSAVHTWVYQRKDKIFLEDSFFKEKRHDPRVEGAVVTKFRNYYRKLRLANPARPPATGSLVDVLVPPATALQLYEDDVQDLLRAQVPGQDNDAYQTRLKDMWLGLHDDMRAQYDRNVKIPALSATVNRKTLTTNLGTALDVLCRDASLGGMMALSFFAFRDSNGEIDFIRCDGRLDDFTVQFGAEDKEKNAIETFRRAWRNYADTIIPSHTPRSSTSSPLQTVIIPRNSQNIPVFPSMDLRTVTPFALKSAMLQYMEAAWIHSRGPLCAMPWGDIAQHPADFYDTETYDFMCFDRAALDDPSRSFPLAATLIERCGIDSRSPFTFMSDSTSRTPHTSTSSRVAAVHAQEQADRVWDVTRETSAPSRASFSTSAIPPSADAIDSDLGTSATAVQTLTYFAHSHKLPPSTEAYHSAGEATSMLGTPFTNGHTGGKRAHEEGGPINARLCHDDLPAKHGGRHLATKSGITGHRRTNAVMKKAPIKGGNKNKPRGLLKMAWGTFLRAMKFNPLNTL